MKLFSVFVCFVLAMVLTGDASAQGPGGGTGGIGGTPIFTVSPYSIPHVVEDNTSSDHDFYGTFNVDDGVTNMHGKTCRVVFETDYIDGGITVSKVHNLDTFVYDDATGVSITLPDNDITYEDTDDWYRSSPPYNVYVWKARLEYWNSTTLQWIIWGNDLDGEANIQ